MKVHQIPHETLKIISPLVDQVNKIKAEKNHTVHASVKILVLQDDIYNELAKVIPDMNGWYELDMAMGRVLIPNLVERLFSFFRC